MQTAKNLEQKPGLSEFSEWKQIKRPVLHSVVCSILVLMSKVGGICAADNHSVARDICRELGRRAHVRANDYGVAESIHSLMKKRE